MFNKGKKLANNQEDDFVWNETVCSPEFSCIEPDEDEDAYAR